MAYSMSSKKGQIPIACQICENDTKIKWKCLDCNHLMCQNCKDKIHPKFANNHTVIDIKEVGLHTKEKKLDFKNIQCKQHIRHECCLFCKNCDHLVCPTCVSKDHNKHDLVEIKEGYEMKVERLKKGLSKFEKDKKLLTEEMGELDGKIISENSKFVEVNQNILTQEAGAIETVKQNAKELMNELDQSSKMIQQTLKQAVDKNELKRRQVNENITTVKSIIDTVDVSMLFQEVEKVEKSINDVVSLTKLNYTALPIFVPGDITLNTVGKLMIESTEEKKVEKLTLSICQQYSTSISHVQTMSSGCNGCLWISSVTSAQLLKVKPMESNLKVEASFNMEVYDMAVTSTNDLLLCLKGPRLKLIKGYTGQLIDSAYCVDPSLQPTAVHLTIDDKIIVGAWSGPNGKKVVIVMKKNGDHETVHKNDGNNKPIFRYPRSITTTYNGNIFVADCERRDDKGIIFVLGPGGDVINTYVGQPEIQRRKKLFRSDNIKTSSSNKVIVADMDNEILHILDELGNLIAYYNTDGIPYPCSLVFAKTGHLYIGCSTPNTSSNNGKLYSVNILGL